MIPLNLYKLSSAVEFILLSYMSHTRICALLLRAELHTAWPWKWRKNLFCFSCCLPWWLLSTPSLWSSLLNRWELLKTSQMQSDLNAGWQASAQMEQAVVRLYCVDSTCVLVNHAVSRLLHKLNRKQCMPWISSKDASWQVTSLWSAGIHSQAYFAAWPWRIMLQYNHCYIIIEL